MYSLFKDLYSDLDRPSIDPVVLFKIVFIQYIFGIRSMRQTIKEIETNVAYSWLLEVGFYTAVPHFFTFCRQSDTLSIDKVFFIFFNCVQHKNRSLGEFNNKTAK
jgi:transposase